MKERVLALDLKGAMDAFIAIRWKFFHVEEDKKTIRVEVPRGYGESYIVELGYLDEENRSHIVGELLGANFIQQSIRITSEW